MVTRDWIVLIVIIIITVFNLGVSIHFEMKDHAYHSPSIIDDLNVVIFEKDSVGDCRYEIYLINELTGDVKYMRDIDFCDEQCNPVPKLRLPGKSRERKI